MSTFLLTDEEHYSIYIATTVTGIFSLIGVVAFIFSFYAIKEFRTEIRRLLAILCVVDGCINILFLLTLWAAIKNDIGCKLVTIAATFLPASSILWTICISFCAYKKLTSDLGMWALSNRLDSMFHILSWGYPSLTVLMMIFSRDYYSYQGYGCWIPRSPLKNQVLRVVCYFIIRWCGFVFNGIMYILIIRRGRKVVEQIPVDVDGNSTQMRQALLEIDDQLKRLGWVPLSFMFLSFWGFINSIKDMLSPERNYLFLDIIQAIGDQAQGCALGILFVFTHKHFRRYCFHKCKSIFRRSPPLNRGRKHRLYDEDGSMMDAPSSWSGSNNTNTNVNNNNYNNNNGIHNKDNNGYPSDDTTTESYVEPLLGTPKNSNFEILPNNMSPYSYVTTGLHTPLPLGRSQSERDSFIVDSRRY